MTAKGTEARVCQDIAARQAKGVSKYGTTVTENPLGMVQWLQHAYEEALDQAVYLKRAIEQLQGVAAPKEAAVHLNLPVVEMPATNPMGQVDPKEMRRRPDGSVVGSTQPGLADAQRANMRAFGWNV